MTEEDQNSSGEEVEQNSLANFHCTKEVLTIQRGKKKGTAKEHFKCNYCSKYYAGPSNSSFVNHLKKVHPNRCPELMKTEKPKPIRKFFSKMRQQFNQDVFMGHLLKLLIRQNLAFSIVDSKDFEDFVDYLRPGTAVNSRTTIMRRLEELYIQMKDKFKEELNGFNSKFSVTCDVWTSKNHLSFFGFTIHFIDHEWSVQERLLAFKLLEVEHDGKSLANAFLDVMTDFELTDRLLGVTADNASNNSTMMAHLETYFSENHPSAGFSVDWNQIECMAHVINLGAKEILSCFKEPVDTEDYEPDSDSKDKVVSALSRLCFLVRKIRKSPKLRRLMKKICEQQGKVYLVPIIDVATRWNSTYDMLVRAIEYKEIINSTIYQQTDKKLKKIVLEEEEWACLDDVVQVLCPLKEVTLQVSKKGASLSITNVMMLYHFCTVSLKQSMQKFDVSDDIYIGIQAAIEKLEHYYDKLSPMVGIAVILDPRMKKEFLVDCLEWEDEWVETIESQFKTAYLFYKNKTSLSNTVVPLSSGSASFPESHSMIYQYQESLNKKRRMDKARDESEIQRYFHSEPLDAKLGPDTVLAFWKSKEFDYPILSAMAKDYLTVQASSVPAERAFSSGTDLVTPARCSMSGKTIEMTQFLKSNIADYD